MRTADDKRTNDFFIALLAAISIRFCTQLLRPCELLNSRGVLRT
jgi:hypothetical protein